jgi:Lipocalin-like domain
VTTNAATAKDELLVGTWKLIGVSSTMTTGEKNATPFGVDPTGFLAYTADGRMSSVISYGGRKPLPISGATLEDQAEAFKTFLAYSGRYELKGDKVIHHVEVSSIQNYVGKDLVRNVRFEENRIILVTPPTPVNGKIQTVELKWQRLPAE